MSGRPFTIIGAVIAVAALGIFVYLGSRAGGNIAAATVNLKPMVVASRDISVRVPLSAADLKVVQIDSAAIPPQSFTKVDELKGLIPVVGIYSGQPVTSNELVASADQLTGAQAGFLPIPKGWVAMTIPTSEQQGVAGFIQPGDYITISAIVAPGGKFENTRTVYTNIHVLRIGQAADTVVLTPVQVRGAVPTPAPKPPTATSMTVVVTQCQAEFLNWFIANATIKYTLESYKDYTPKDVAVDNSCPGVDSARGVTLVEVARNWPGLAS